MCPENINSTSKFYKKNDAFNLYYVNPRTKYGFMYSHKYEKMFFLNPLAVEVWNSDDSYVIPEKIIDFLLNTLKIFDAPEYIHGIIAEMEKKELILDEKSYKNREKCKDSKASKKYPLDMIYYYVTKDCNLKCYHCYQETKKVPSKQTETVKNEISTETFMEAVKQALPLGLKGVKITGGEPFLRKKTVEIIKELAKLNLCIIIESNGTMINESIAKIVADKNVDVSISIDAGSASLHDKLRGHRGSFDQAIRALKLLNSYGLRPAVIMAVSKINYDEIEHVIGIAKEHNCRMVKINPLVAIGISRNLNREIFLDIMQITGLFNKRKELESTFGIQVLIEGPPGLVNIDDVPEGHMTACPFTRILGILSDGSVSFCGIGNTNPELIFGHIGEKEVDINKIWNKSNLLVRVRKMLDKKLEGVCQKCVLELFCKGSCRALAYSVYSSFTSPHPWCQFAFERGLFQREYLKPPNLEKGGDVCIEC